MNKKYLFKLIILGLIAGFCSGLFASGGGLILLSELELILKLDEKKSRAITIFCILPMVITSIFFYNNKQTIDWKLGIICAISGCVGAIIGTKILKKAKVKILKICFVIFLFISAYMMFRK